MHRPAEVDVELPVEGLGIHRRQGLGSGRAGVGDHDIRRPAGTDGRSRGQGGLAVGEIEGPGLDHRQARQGHAGMVAGHHGGAQFGEQADQRRTEPAAGAGDDHPPALEAEHRRSVPPLPCRDN